jgi:hypothetical protein
MTSPLSSLARSARPRFAFAWYYHLPVIASRLEVEDHARRSLALLLRIHRQRRVAVLIAPTGSFLSLCQRYAPDVVEQLRDCVNEGTVVLGATYMHEIDPFTIAWRHVREQICRDYEYKAELFGDGPRWFFTPNFTWHPGIPKVLGELGVCGVILDSRHLAAAATARAWNWSSDDAGPVRVTDASPYVAPWEHRRIRSYEWGQHHSIRLVFRDWPLTRVVTFGNTSAIQSSRAASRITEVVSELVESTGEMDLMVIADDGDRVKTSSRRGYEALLDIAAHFASWNELIDEDLSLPRIRELPAFSQPGFDELLRTSLDARFYWSLLTAIAELELDAVQFQTLLALQDVFYPFWRGSGRRRWYVDTALALLDGEPIGDALRISHGEDR